MVLTIILANYNPPVNTYYLLCQLFILIFIIDWPKTGRGIPGLGTALPRRAVPLTESEFRAQTDTGR